MTWLTWYPSPRPGIAEELLDAVNKPTGHVIYRGTVSGIYSGDYHGEPIGRASMEIYSVRKACEAHARGK